MTLRTPQSGIPPTKKKPPIAEELDYLGEFSDPELVKQHLAIEQAKELEQNEAEFVLDT